MTANAPSTGSNAISSAVNWLEQTLLGSAAAAVAVIAIAAIGLLMLTGRIDMRRSARVILGCFIIFGASTIAAGIQASIFGSSGERAEPAELPPPPSVLPQPPPQASPSTYDPYAGAGLAPTQ